MYISSGGPMLVQDQTEFYINFTALECENNTTQLIYTYELERLLSFPSGNQLFSLFLF